VALADVCIHRATPLETRLDTQATGTYLEGERDDETPAPAAVGKRFACVLFLPLGGEEPNPFRRRKITRPTLLFLPTAEDGSAVSISADSELLIEAPDLAAFTGGAQVRWQVDGDPQPFGPPGEVIGAQATLSKVD
jgi:DNA mismatch repair protein MutH